MINIDSLIKTTNNFYKSVGSEFDQTRQSYWKGWDKIVEHIYKVKSNKPVSILDAGCGNGRFLEFLLSDGRMDVFSYTGIDFDDFLLLKGKNKFELIQHSKVEFIQKDIITDLKSINDEFDVVVAFGITHHIPGANFRKQWFKNLANCVAPNGFLIFSNWQINTIENFKEKIIKTDFELEDNDYILGWNDSDAQRYVHIYTDDEMIEIEAALKELGLKKMLSFEDDGRNSKMNTYYIFQKS